MTIHRTYWTVLVRLIFDIGLKRFSVRSFCGLLNVNFHVEKTFKGAKNYLKDDPVLVSINQGWSAITQIIRDIGHFKIIHIL